MKVLACVVLAACAAEVPATGNEALVEAKVQAKTQVQVELNDVSILYPISLFGGYVSALELALNDSASQLPPSILLAAYAVSAVRFDPCFASLDPQNDDNCTDQMRLVLQSAYADSGIHLLYKISRKDLLSAVGKLAKARHGRELGALAVHPILEEEGLYGEYASLVRKIILDNASADNLMRLTLFYALGDGNWQFDAYAIENRLPVKMDIPATPRGSDHVSVVHFDDMSPETTSSDNMRPLLSERTADDATPAEQQAALDSIFRIENPRVHSSETIDCGSCHFADPSKRRVAEDILGLSMDNTNAFTSTQDLTQSIDVSRARTPNIHMFSYYFAEPMIAQRTINETALVVEYLNSL